MLDSSPIGVLVGDQTGRLLSANDQALAWLGAHRRDLEAGTLSALTLLAKAEAAQTDTPSDAQAWTKVLGQSSGIVYEKTMRDAGTEALPLSVELKRFGEGDGALVAAYLQDLRPFKLVEQALRAQGAELEGQVQRCTQELEVRNQVLEAFELLSRELTLEADPHTLVQRAQAIVLPLLPAGVATYYELEGQVWRLKVQTGDLRNPALQAVLNAGLPYQDADNLRLPLETRQGYYQTIYDVDTDRRPQETSHIGASVTLPVSVHGEVRGVFGLGLFGGPREWSSTDRSRTPQSVVRSLGLALERAESVAQLSARTPSRRGSPCPGGVHGLYRGGGYPDRCTDPDQAGGRNTQRALQRMFGRLLPARRPALEVTGLDR